ncbi:MAG: hypothetical protein ACH37Z_11520, partial [Anaerolineae bacterium]
MKKPIPRNEFIAAAAAEHDRLMLEYEATLPRHPRITDYLAARPVEGVTTVDRSDGLGPRAVDWPEDMPHPDVDAWEAERQAAIAEAERLAEEAARE